MAPLRRALVIHPADKSVRSSRSAPRKLEEAIGLAAAIDLQVIQALVAPIRSARPATLFGVGKVEEVAGIVQEHSIELAIVDSALSPIQQRNLEKAWNCKVIDRTALILEIFGARARTREGKLQVELAALNYQKSRLVRSWTHLERQRGGFGFLGGPGESQIETDRRLIRDRIAKLRRELDNVVRTRELHRKKRRDVPYPLLALVGYTNAGKSTLFNRLTKSDVLAKDILFATLDPTIRSLTLPSGLKVMLSDTVGFVSDLPTDLIAAFRATLEEVIEADLILHVRDISHPEMQEQKQDVETVLENLFNGDDYRDHLIEVLNKVDLLTQDQRNANSYIASIPVSALTGEGLETLLKKLDAELATRFHVTRHYTMSPAEGKKLAWLHAHGQVLSSDLRDELLHLTVCLTPQDAAQFEQKIDTGKA